MSGISELWAGIAGVILLVTMVALGVRVYVAAALTGFLGLLALKGWNVAAAVAGTIPHSKTVTYPLSVLPLFILIGFLAFHAGLTTRLFEAARRWVGWVPGGLAVSTVFASAGFAAVSGASTATAAVFSRVAIPDMLRNRYSKRLTAGVIAAGGTLASLIPPSAILVIYAIIVEESVGKLLLAGLLPGVVSVLIYASLIVGMCAVRPDLGRSIHGFTWRERFASLPGALPIFLVVGIIFGALYSGAATPTEAGALGAAVVFGLYALRAYRERSVKQMGSRLREALMETAKLTVMIFTLIWGVFLFVRFLGFAGLPGAFADWVVTLDMPPTPDRRLHPARLRGARHVHGRHRNAGADAAGGVSGRDRAWLRPDMVRHRGRQDGGNLSHHAAHRTQLFRCCWRRAGIARPGREVARNTPAGCVSRHRSVLRRRRADGRRAAGGAGDRAVAAPDDGLRTVQ